MPPPPPPPASPTQSTRRKKHAQDKYAHVQAKVPTVKQARLQQQATLAGSSNLQQQQHYQQQQQQKRQRDDVVKQMWARIDALNATQEQRWPSQGANAFLSSAGSTEVSDGNTKKGAQNAQNQQQHLTTQEMAALAQSRKALLDEIATSEEEQNNKQIEKFSAASGGCFRSAISHATDYPPAPVVHVYNSGPFVTSSPHKDKGNQHSRNNTPSPSKRRSASPSSNNRRNQRRQNTDSTVRSVQKSASFVGVSSSSQQQQNNNNNDESASTSANPLMDHEGEKSRRHSSANSNAASDSRKQSVTMTNTHSEFMENISSLDQLDRSMNKSVRKNSATNSTTTGRTSSRNNKSSSSTNDNSNNRVNSSRTGEALSPIVARSPTATDADAGTLHSDTFDRTVLLQSQLQNNRLNNTSNVLNQNVSSNINAVLASSPGTQVMQGRSNPIPPPTWLEHLRLKAADLEFTDYLYARYLFFCVDQGKEEGFIRLHDLVQYRLHHPTKISLSSFEHLMLKGDGRVYIDEWVSMFFPNIQKAKLSATIREYEGAFNLPFVCLTGGQKKELRKMYEKMIVNETEHEKMVTAEFERLAQEEEIKRKQQKFRAFADDGSGSDEDGDSSSSRSSGGSSYSSASSSDDDLLQFSTKNNQIADFSPTSARLDERMTTPTTMVLPSSLQEAKKKKRRSKNKKRQQQKKQQQEHAFFKDENNDDGKQQQTKSVSAQFINASSGFATISAKLLDRCHTSTDDIQSSAAILINRLKKLKSEGKSTLDRSHAAGGGALSAIKVIARMASWNNKRREEEETDDSDEDDLNQTRGKRSLKDLLFSNKKKNGGGANSSKDPMNLSTRKRMTSFIDDTHNKDEADDDQNPFTSDAKLDDVEFGNRFASETDFDETMKDNEDDDEDDDALRLSPSKRLELPTSWRVKAKERQDQKETEEEEEKQKMQEKKREKEMKEERNAATSPFKRKVVMQDAVSPSPRSISPSKNSKNTKTNTSPQTSSAAKISGNWEDDINSAARSSNITPTSHVIISQEQQRASNNNPAIKVNLKSTRVFSSSSSSPSSPTSPATPATGNNSSKNAVSSPTSTTSKGNTNNNSNNNNNKNTSGNNIYSTLDGSPTPLSPAPNNFTSARLSLLDFFELLSRNDVVFSPCEVVHLLKWRGGKIDLELDDVCSWLARAAVAGNMKSQQKQRDREERTKKMMLSRVNNSRTTSIVVATDGLNGTKNNNITNTTTNNNNVSIMTSTSASSSSPTQSSSQAQTTTLLNGSSSSNNNNNNNNNRRRRSSISYGHENKSFQTDLQKSINDDNDPIQNMKKEHIILDYFEAFHLIQEQLSTNPIPKYHDDIRNPLLELLGVHYLQLLSRWVAQKQIHGGSSVSRSHHHQNQPQFGSPVSPKSPLLLKSKRRESAIINYIIAPPPPSITINASEIVSNLVDLCPQCRDRTTAICISIAAGAKTVSDRKAAQSEAALKSLLTSKCTMMTHPILLLSAVVPFNAFQLLDQQIVACPERVMNTIPTVLTPAAALQLQSLEIFRDSCVAGGKPFDLPNKETNLPATYVDELLAESRNHVSDLFRKVRQRAKAEKLKKDKSEAWMKREEEQRRKMMIATSTSGDRSNENENEGSIVARLEMGNVGSGFEEKKRWK